VSGKQLEWREDDERETERGAHAQEDRARVVDWPRPGLSRSMLGGFVKRPLCVFVCRAMAPQKLSTKYGEPPPGERRKGGSPIGRSREEATCGFGRATRAEKY
jgi:hypothetical protein